MSADLYSAWRAKERAELDKIRAAKPGLLERPQPPDPDFILGMIGVTYLPETRTRGYIRLYPQDFIVEEVAKDGTLVSLSRPPEFSDSEDRRTLYVDLVKAGIAHLHAIHDIEKTLSLQPGQVGHAGIKDSAALTCQRLSLRGVTKEEAEALQHPNMFLRPVSYGSGALQPGDLDGNRFSIVVRTENGAFDEALLDRLGTIGGYNFYGPQRFGFRMVLHRFAQKIFQGDIDGAIKLYLTKPGPFDVPLFREVRESLANVYGDWKRMLQIVQFLPSSMRDEIRILESLVRDPRKTRAALMTIQDRVKFAAAAYSSWVMNRHLSRLVEAGGDLPEELPLPLAPGGIPAGYADIIEQDGTEDYESVIAQFPFLQLHTKTIPTRLRARMVAWEPIEQGVVLRFELGKGSYATSFLSHAFRLYEGLPIPEWVQDGEVDGLAVIGDGTIAPFKERFKEILVKRDPNREKTESED
ncbi:tRNA pseudouridine(13) synthase TruD [Candidatus Uhrbacteria bacterium]|nr:MAG: tRNA pseudouridine(13) synthase TruD [Candidatus Uhrbacteria bacterium]